MPHPDPDSFDLDARLVDQRERNLGALVPVPVSERVDALADVLDRAGHGRIARKEIMAAILLASTDDADELAELLKRYRTARVRDALVEEPAAPNNLVTFPTRAPGPRARGN